MQTNRYDLISGTDRFVVRPQIFSGSYTASWPGHWLAWAVVAVCLLSPVPSQALTDIPYVRQPDSLLNPSVPAAIRNEDLLNDSGGNRTGRWLQVRPESYAPASGVPSLEEKVIDGVVEFVVTRAKAEAALYFQQQLKTELCAYSDPS